MRSPGSRIASAKWRNWPRVQTLLPRSPPRPLLSSLNSTSISSLLSAPRSNFRCVGKMHRADNSPRLPLYFARGPFCDLAQKLCELSLQDPKNQFKASQDGPGKGTAHCFTRSDVTSVERGVRMSQCGQAPLGMRIEGVGDSHFS